MKGLADLSRYAILYDMPKGEYDPRQVGGIRTKTTRAGDSLEVDAYPYAQITREAVREHLRRKTSVQMEQANINRARRYFRQLAEANFTAEDYALHLTFDYALIDRYHGGYDEIMRQWDREGLPFDEDDARRIWNNYLNRVRYHLRKAGFTGDALKHLYVIEVTRQPNLADPNPMPPRFHFHLLIHAPGLDRDALEKLWGRGFAQARHLDFHDNGLEGLTNYITKQRGLERYDTEGRRFRRWGRSKNLKEPTVTVSDRKISRRRAALVAADVNRDGKQIFEAIYPGYQCMEVKVKYSDFVAGAYIYARLRRQPTDPPWMRAGGSKRRNEGRQRE